MRAHPGEDTASAFAAYEAVRHRLPAVRRAGACAGAATLEDLADRFDVFLLDAFGVLNIGEDAIPGVPARIAALQAAGKRVIVVSNAAGYPHDVLMARYDRLGYRFAPDDVISSRKALLRALAAEPPTRWGLMASERFGRAEIGHLQAEILAEDRVVYDQAEGFALFGSADWTEACQSLLQASLRAAPRRVLVGNPDIVAPVEHGLSREPGFFAHRLADATGVGPEFLGKPFPAIYELAFERIGPDPDRSRIVMVGDTLHTDILGGQVAGVATALVAGYGFFAGGDVDGAIRASGIAPDFVLERP